MRKEPPVILVETWLHLINSSESKEVRDRAYKMLVCNFGDIEAAGEFCRRHQKSLHEKKISY